MIRSLLLASYIIFINQGFCGLTLDFLPDLILNQISEKCTAFTVQEKLHFCILNKRIKSYIERTLNTSNNMFAKITQDIIPDLNKDENLPDNYVQKLKKIFAISYKYRIPLNIILKLKENPLPFSNKEGITDFLEKEKLKKKKSLFKKIFFKKEKKEIFLSLPDNNSDIPFSCNKVVLKSALNFFDIVNIDKEKIPYIESIFYEYNNGLTENFENAPGFSSLAKYEKDLQQNLPHLKKFSFQLMPYQEPDDNTFNENFKEVLSVVTAYFKMPTLTHKHLNINCNESDFIAIMEQLLPAIPSAQLTYLYLGNRFWGRIKETKNLIIAFTEIFEKSPCLKTMILKNHHIDTNYFSHLMPFIKEKLPLLEVFSENQQIDGPSNVKNFIHK